MSASKLLEFQKKVGAITKDSINPFFKSNYFDINKLIEAIKPILNELGLVLLQPLVSGEVNGRLAIKTIIIDADTDKELISGIAVLPENSDPQKMGSIITYFRRYAVQSLLFLQAEDDDGNAGAVKDIPYKKIASPSVQKEAIAKLLKANSPIEPKTAKDYADVCKDLTGLELKPENYEAILNSLNN